MPKISFQNKSFIILFGIAIVGTYLCLMLWADLNPGSVYLPANSKTDQNGTAVAYASSLFNTQIPNIDTSSWQAYTDKASGLNFKYKPDWKVKPAVEKDGYRIIEIDPGKKFYNIKIYISPTDYYAMSGLPTKPDSIGGQPAINVNNMLYGVKNKNTFFTFDVGLSSSLTNDFNGLIHSVSFSE
ncbi:MAG: hypothetical protein HY918_03720 [Candidatus Doudnabacteria bacterium]|nr:hypothetical protein [Candidatus Doudnabacteria bacterium]